MEYKRSTPRKAWTCYFDGDEENKLSQLEKMFPMVQFILEESKLVISRTGEKLLDRRVEKVIAGMGGIRV